MANCLLTAPVAQLEAKKLLNKGMNLPHFSSRFVFPRQRRMLSPDLPVELLYVLSTDFGGGGGGSGSRVRSRKSRGPRRIEHTNGTATPISKLVREAEDAATASSQVQAQAQAAASVPPPSLPSAPP